MRRQPCAICSVDPKTKRRGTNETTAICDRCRADPANVDWVESPADRVGRRVVGTPWLTADEATVYLGFPSRKALYQAVRRGQVPGHRIGRRLRFSRSEVDSWLSRNRTVAAIAI
jgi:excisionase family DNA binding protein